MNVFKSIFHSRDKPNNRSGGTPGFLFGSATSGKPVNERTAMQTSAVYACVRILSESIAGLPLHVYRCNRDGAGTSGASKEYTDFHPLYRLLRLSPNAEMTAGVFIETAVTHLLIYGNFYAQIIRYGRVYPLSPSKMTAERNDYGEFVYTCNSGKGQFCLRNRDILHVPALGYDGLAGHLPHRDGEKRHRAFPCRGGLRRGVIKPEQADRLRESRQASGKPAVAVRRRECPQGGGS